MRKKLFILAIIAINNLLFAEIEEYGTKLSIEKTTQILNTFAIDEKSSLQTQRSDLNRKNLPEKWFNCNDGDAGFCINLNKDNSTTNLKSIDISSFRYHDSTYKLEMLNINKKYITDTIICYDDGPRGGYKKRYIVKLPKKKPFMLSESYFAGEGAGGNEYSILFNYDKADCNVFESKYFTFEDGWIEYKNSNYETAINIWKQTASSGDIRSQLYLGKYFQYGKSLKGFGGKIDDDEAIKWYLLAAKHKINDQKKQEFTYLTEAQYELGYIYESGTKQKKIDYKKAIEWYSKAGENNYEAAFNLAMIYKNKLKDTKNALVWLRQAEWSGHPFAKAEIRKIYENMK
jgi:TPR repeat protein